MDWRCLKGPLLPGPLSFHDLSSQTVPVGLERKIKKISMIESDDFLILNKLTG